MATAIFMLLQRHNSQICYQKLDNYIQTAII